MILSSREVGYDSNPTIFFSYVRFLLFVFRVIYVLVQQMMNRILVIIMSVKEKRFAIDFDLEDLEKENMRLREKINKLETENKILKKNLDMMINIR